MVNWHNGPIKPHSVQPVNVLWVPDFADELDASFLDLILSSKGYTGRSVYLFWGVLFEICYLSSLVLHYGCWDTDASIRNEMLVSVAATANMWFYAPIWHHVIHLPQNGNPATSQQSPVCQFFVNCSQATQQWQEPYQRVSSLQLLNAQCVSSAARGS